MLNILFTSVGRRVELLRAFRVAYAAMPLNGHIVAVDIDRLAPALQVADRPYIVPRLDAPDYVATLAQICRTERVDLVFPLIDPDIGVLSRHKAEIEATGARVAVVAPEAAETTGDKWLTYRFFCELGIRAPQSWLPGDINGQDIEYPVFIKPRKGSAAKQTFQVTNEHELSFFSGYIQEPIIQEYLPGPEITNDVICHLQGDVLAVVSRQRIEVRWGEVAKGVTIYHPGITAACVKIAQTLPAVGPITVQCIMKDGVPYFTEINARFGGGVPLGIAAGVDSPRWLLAKAAGLPVDIPPLGTYNTGLYLTRFDDSFFLSETDVEQMQSCHI
jgi:carbamoyl-phosphate synthase large subunit